MEPRDEPPPARVPALDGLRGVAVLLVLLAHSSNVQIVLARRGAWALDFRGCGRAGVFLFFVLSAFLLTGQLLGRSPRDLARPRVWGRYALRRALRIFPAYVLCLALYVLLEGWGGRRALEHLATTRAELHFWTVPVELRFYLLLPLAAFALALLRGRTAASLLLLAAAAVAARIVQPPDYGSRAPDYAVRLLPFVPVFLVGCATAVAHHAWRGWSAEGRARWARAFDVLAVLAVLGLALHAPAVTSLVTGTDVDLHRFHMEFDRLALLFGALLLGLLQGGGGLRRLVEGRALRFVGAVSYSTYLLHKLILVRIEVPARAWPRPWPALTFLGLSLLAGTVSWWLVERPFLSLGRRPRTGAASTLAGDASGR